MTRRRWAFAAVAAIAVLLVVGRIIAGWYVDYQWYAALGASDVWRDKAINLLQLRGTTFLIGTVFVFLNLYAVRHSIRKLVLPRRVGNLDIGEEVPGRYLLIAVIVISVMIGGLLALPHNDWISLDLVRNALPFGETDPYFQRDLAFWVFWLPLESSLHVWALISLLVVVLVVVFLYALTPSLRWDSGRLYVSGYVRRHLFTLGAVLLLLMSWSYRLDAYELLLSGSGPLGTFSAIDHQVGLPSMLVLSALAVAAAMLMFWSGWTGQIRLAFFTLTTVLLGALVLREIVPTVAERFVRPADPEVRDQPYRATRSGYTRRAFDVDRVVREDTAAPAQSFADAARGASLWDGAALTRTLAGDGGGAKPNGSVGWDLQDGRVVAVAVEQPSGIDTAESAPQWRVLRIAADMADERGGVVSRVDPDASPASRLPSVLLHDSAASYYVIADSADHVAAPELRSFVSRLAHAWHLQNPRLLSANASGAHVRVLLRRDVRDRVRSLYPFFAQGSRLTPVLWRDSLFWAVQLYTTSNWYPLSQGIRFGRDTVRYLRHAAVALVNSHTGRVIAALAPDGDPFSTNWYLRFPSLFVETNDLDADLRKRLPPPVDGAVLAAQAFAQVGVRGGKNPTSHLPHGTGGDTLFSLATLAPYYDHATGLLSVAIPILDSLDRVRGVVTAGGGLDFRLQWRPLHPVGPRWATLIEQLQRPTDSLQTVIRDTRVLQGPVRIIPTSEGMLALQTHYTTRLDATPQELYVSVLHGDSLATGLTVASAIGIPVPAPAQGPPTPQEFRAQVESLYAAMRDALRRGDWRAFGTAYESLGKLLNRR
jgi:uncharacterized protein